MRNGTLRTTVAAVAMAAAMAVTGCGDDDGGEGGGGADAKGGGSAPIKLRAIAAIGTGLQNYPDIEAGGRAAAAAINEAGGVNGRKIEFSFCNTRADANQSQRCSREAVEDRVTAVVAQTDTFGGPSNPIFDKGDIPVIGASSNGAESDWTTRIQFPLHAGNPGMYTTLPYAFAKEGRKRVVVLSVDLPVGLAEADMVNNAAKAAGMEFAPTIKIPTQGVTDYAPFAQQIKDARADSVVMILGPAAISAVLKASGSLGGDLRFGTQVYSFGESEARDVGEELAKTVMVGSPYPSPRDTKEPGVAQYVRELDAAGIGKDPVLRRGAGLSAWASVHAAAEVARTIKGDVTNTSMIEALEKARNIRIGEMVDWSPATLGSPELGRLERFPVADYHALVFEDGRLVDSGLGTFPDPVKPDR